MLRLEADPRRAAAFLRLLARPRAEAAQLAFRAPVQARWSGLLAVAARGNLASSFLKLPLAGGCCVAGKAPEPHEVLTMRVGCPVHFNEELFRLIVQFCSVFVWTWNGFPLPANQLTACPWWVQCMYALLHFRRVPSKPECMRSGWGTAWRHAVWHAPISQFLVHQRRLAWSKRAGNAVGGSGKREA